MDAVTERKRFALLARITADFILVNFCLVFSVWLSVTVRVLSSGNEQLVVSNIVDKFYLHLLGLLTLSLVVVMTFLMGGVYSKASKLSVRKKSLYVFVASAVAFLLFGALHYFSGNAFGLSASSIVLAWAVTSTALVLTRAWSVLWRKMTIQSVNSKDLPHYMDEKSVLVIGGAGYIGSALVPKLLNDGYKVRILDVLVYGDDAIAPYLDHPRLELIQADFRHVDSVVTAVKGMSAVIHLGAIVGDPACAIDENMTIEINLMATRMIAEVCKGFGVKRFIFASTCSVYGASDDVLDETSSLNPVSLYARSKIACENVLHKLADDSFIPVILRFSTIFGLSGRMRFDLVVNLLSAKAMLDKQITVINGDQWRPFLHVDDAAQSVFAAMKAPINVVKNQVYNVGSDSLNYTIKQAGELINQQVPEAELLDLVSDQDRRNYRVSFDKIQSQLNYKTKWTLQQGILQVIDAVKAGQVVSYKDPKYSNASYLKEAVLYKSQAAYYNSSVEELAFS